MKRFNKLTLLLMSVVILSGLSGCKAKVDFDNIDTRMQAEMGLGIPVGSMLVTANDFLGGNQISKIRVDEQGVFHYIDTLDIPTRNFHALNLEDYVGKSDTAFKVKKQLEENGYLDASGWVKDSKKGSPIELKFPLTVRLNGINSETSNERVDSVQVTNANLNSVVNVTDLGLQWSWINSVDVVMNNQFRRPAGKKIRLYSKGDGYNYGEWIPVTVDQFTVSLMKDESKTPGADNVVDTCGFTFLFNFTIPVGENVQIKESSAFNYYFETKFINFDAAWGFFQSSKDFRDRDQFSIDSVWDDWKNIKKMKVRLMEPRVKVEASHHIAAPLIVYLDTLMVCNETEHIWGTWGGQKSTEVVLKDVLDPHSPLTDSIWNDYTFSEDPDSGHIDQLFNIRPDSIYYSFRMMVNPKAGPELYPWSQHRITNNTAVNAYARMDIPFKVDKESEAEYVTQFSNIDFSKVNLDSLLNTIEVLENAEAKHVKLYMLWFNTLPFDVDAKVWFLRPDSSVMNLSIFEGLAENEVHLPAPKMARNQGDKYGYVTEPSTTTIIMDMTQEQFDSLAVCKHLKLDAFMGKNMEPAVIDTASSLTVRVGVAADVKAIINLQKKNQ